MDELEQAKYYHQQALEIRKTHLSQNDVNAATFYINLGSVHFKMGEFEQTKDYHQQAVEINKTQLGPSHVDVATSYNNLGAVFYEMGELELASGEASPTFGHANVNFSVFIYRPYNKESISKEINNDNDLNLHLHDQMSGWLRYWNSLGIVLIKHWIFRKHN